MMRRTKILTTRPQQKQLVIVVSTPHSSRVGHCRS